MKNLISKHSFLLAAIILVSLSAAGQPGRAPRLISPEVNANNSISFRIYAPDATAISLSGNWMDQGPGQVALSKGDSGVWSLTTPVLPPEIYTYSFYVNGVKTLDPANPLIIRDGTRFESMVVVPGKESEVYMVKDVPHGRVSKVWYPSPTLGKNRRMFVYTPPGYENSTDKYPVFYLLHGGGGDEEAWTTLGRTPWILDNLIAGNQAKPMIVVMTNGNARSAAAPGEEPFSAGNPARSPGQPGMPSFEESLVKDVIPYIEQNFRTLTDKNSRAIAGLSMGGMHTQNITNANPDLFGYIGVMSMGLRINPRDGNYNPENHKKQLLAIQEKGVNLYWIACGKEDFLFQSVTDLRRFYDEIGFRYVYRESTGGHTWPNWRIYLSELAPLLFR